MTRLTALAAAVVVTSIGDPVLAGDNATVSDVPEVLDIVGYPAAAGERPHGMYMVVDADNQTPEDGAPSVLANARWLFYMNRNGGVYVPANNNDSRNNQSSVPQQTSQIPPWNVSEQDWQFIMSCVQQQFAAYDVEVTDIDPGNLPHLESVVAGEPQNLQLPPGVGGVSPFRNDCGTIDNSIVFTFAEVFGNNLPLICDVVAQEIAHSFGLDHELLASDPMTYLPFQGQRSFQNIDAQCGEDQPRLCFCGQQTQNSVVMLTERLGLKQPGLDPVAPELDISFPLDGSIVPPGFQVQVAATDDVAVTRVELYIDGELVTALTQEPWRFFAPQNLVDGIHTIETRAYDSENTSTTSIQVTVDANAPDPGQPGDPGRNDVLTGGCSVGSGGAPGGLALLALGLLTLRRRRRA